MDKRKKRPREPLPLTVKLGITEAILNLITFLCLIGLLLIWYGGAS